MIKYLLNNRKRVILKKLQAKIESLMAIPKMISKKILRKALLRKDFLYNYFPQVLQNIPQQL